MEQETRYQRVGREQRERQAAREAARQAAAKKHGRRSNFSRREIALQRIADRIDGYDRDDIGLSPDF